MGKEADGEYDSRPDYAYVSDKDQIKSLQSRLLEAHNTIHTLQEEKQNLINAIEFQSKKHAAEKRNIYFLYGTDNREHPFEVEYYISFDSNEKAIGFARLQVQGFPKHRWHLSQITAPIVEGQLDSFTRVWKYHPKEGAMVFSGADGWKKDEVKINGK